METKRNLKYFIAPPISVVTIVGLAITVISIVLMFFESTRIYGIMGLIVGLGISVFTSGGKATDTDLEYQAAEFTKDLEENSMKKNEVYEKNFLKAMKPLNLRGFDFDDTLPDFHYKKGRDGTHRTNYFMGANLIFTSEKVYIYSRHFSLTDESHDDTVSVSYKYTDLDRAELEEKKFNANDGKENVELTLHIFKLFKHGDKCVFKMNIDYGADSDLAVENINRTIRVRTDELRKLSEEKAQKIADFRAKVAKEAEEEQKNSKKSAKKEKTSEIVPPQEDVKSEENVSEEKNPEIVPSQDVVESDENVSEEEVIPENVPSQEDSESDENVSEEEQKSE